MFNTNNLIGINPVNSVDFVKLVFQSYNSGDVLVILKQAHSELSLKATKSPASGGGWLTIKQEVIQDDRTAQIVYSSGTEDIPKAILLSHRALADVAIRLNKFMKVDETIREYIGVPVTYSFGLGRCRAVAAAGGQCFIPEQGFNPSEIARMIKDDGINAISAVPTLWRTLLAQSEIVGELGSKVKWIEIGSQYMGRAEKEKMKSLFPNAIIVQHYGLTEASRTTLLNISETSGELLDSVGQATGTGEVKISPDGLIMTRGPQVATGQLILNEVKELVDAEGWYTTTDIGHIANNFLYYDGRADDLINCAGVKINPDLLQEKINRRLKLENKIAVSRIDDALRGDGFFIAIEIDAAIKLDEVRDIAFEELLTLGINAKSSIQVQEVKLIPRTDTGKVQRKALSKLYSYTAPKKANPPLPEPNSSIREVFNNLFPGVSIKSSDSFKSLGGDSLNYIQMLMLLEARLGSAPSDWDKMSIQKLEQMTKKKSSFFYSWLDTSIFLRVIAILGVVATHSGGPVPMVGGGTLLLFALIGYNMARFKSTEFFDGKYWHWLKTYALIILIPYYILVAVYMGANKSFDIDELLLYTNLINARLSTLFPFWFVQVLLQCLILFGLIFSIKPLRKYASESPVIFSVLGLFSMIAIRAIYPYFWDTTHLNNLVPLRFMAILWLGWSFYFVKNLQQKFLIFIAGIGFAFLDTGLLWGFEFSFQNTVLMGPAKWLMLGSLFLAFAPQIPVPTFTKKIFNDIGAGTFYIFVLNGVVIKLLEKVFHVSSVLSVFVLTVMGTLLIWWAFERVKLTSRLFAYVTQKVASKI